jgi:hypothetical protein
MLWAVTCYFNPAGYRRKLDNYRIFRRHLAVPLVCVELSFSGVFALGPEDAETLIQIRGQSVLWQKERLLNIALQAVPTSCEVIAWVDCDVIFERSDWPDLALHTLRDRRLIQLFNTRCNLARTAGSDPVDLSQIDSQAASLGYKLATGRATADDVRRSDAPLTLASTAGVAWAAHRDLVARHGLYDACILGTTDRVIVSAALGVIDYGRDAVLMNEPQLRHYRMWGEPFHAAMQGQVGYIEGRAFHLWHGALEDRRYQERHEGLRWYTFDPFADLALDSSGCWRWSTDKPDMHAYVRAYFAARDEDGVGRPDEVPHPRAQDLPTGG